MIKAILFDIDGTLLDSREANIAFYQRIFGHAGLTIPPREKIIPHLHSTLHGMLTILATDLSVIEADLLQERAKEIPYPIEMLKVFPHSCEIVKLLSSHYQLALVTNRRRKGVDDYFTVSQLREYFPVIVAAGDVVNPKPHPEPLLKALQQLQLQASEAIYVGDTAADVQAAKAAGMKVVLCTSVVGADAYVTSLNQLPEVLSRFSRR